MTAYFQFVTAAAVVSAYEVPTNIHVSPVNTSFTYFRSAGAGAATEVSAFVQITIDPPNATVRNWFNIKDGSANMTEVSAITFPHASMRLSITAVSGSVAIAFAVLNVGM